MYKHARRSIINLEHTRTYSEHIIPELDGNICNVEIPMAFEKLWSDIIAGRSLNSVSINFSCTLFKFEIVEMVFEMVNGCARAWRYSFPYRHIIRMPLARDWNVCTRSGLKITHIIMEHRALSALSTLYSRIRTWLWPLKEWFGSRKEQSFCDGIYESQRRANGELDEIVGKVVYESGEYVELDDGWMALKAMRKWPNRMCGIIWLYAI